MASVEPILSGGSESARFSAYRIGIGKKSFMYRFTDPIYHIRCKEVFRILGFILQVKDHMKLTYFAI